MLSKKVFALFLVCLLAFTATGCRVFGPGGDDETTAAPTAKLSVVVAKPAAGAAASIRASVRAAVQREPLAGAKVEIVYSDGTKDGPLTEDPANPGSYLLELTDAIKEKLKLGFVIKAIKGELELVNIVTPDETLGDSVEANESTTAYAYIAIDKAKGEDGKSSKPEDIINSFYTLTIDFKALKETFTSGDDSVNKIIQFVINIIIKADENAENPAKTLFEDLGNKEEDGKKITDIVTENPVTAPVKSDEDLVKALGQRFVTTVFDYYSTKLDTNYVNTMADLMSETFLHNGMDKAKVKDDLLKGYTPNTGELIPTNFSVSAMQVTKLNDTTYLVGPNGNLTFTGGSTEEVKFENGFSINQTMDQYSVNRLMAIDVFPFLVVKENNKWLIKGNGIRVEEVNVNLALQNWSHLATNKERASFWFEVRPGTAAISKIEVTGPAITGTLALTEVTMGEDKNWVYKPANDPSSYPTEGLTIIPSVGDEYVVTITYAAGTPAAQTFKFKVPELTGISPLSTGVTVAANQAGTGLDLTWPLSTLTDFDGYVIALNNGTKKTRIQEEIQTKSTVTKTLNFPANTASGDVINVQISVFTKRGVAAEYKGNFTVPDLTKNAAVTMVTALENGLPEVANAMQHARPVMPTGGSNMRLSGVAATGFPEGTLFFDTYADYADLNLEKVFKFAAPANSNITQFLIQFYGPVVGLLGNPLPMTPHGLDMYVRIEKTLTGLGSLVMNLQNDKNTNVTLEDYYYSENKASVLFVGTGYVEAQVNGQSFKVEMTQIGCDVRLNASNEVEEVIGNFSASLKTADGAFMIDEKPASIINGSFDQEGLSNTAENPAQVRVDFTGYTDGNPDGTLVATIARNAQGVLQLTILAANPAQNEVIDIQ